MTSTLPPTGLQANEILVTLIERLTALKNDPPSFEPRIARLEASMEVFAVNQREMREDMREFRLELKEFKGEFYVFKDEVHKGFKEIRQEVYEFKAETYERFDKVYERFDKVYDRLDKIHERMHQHFLIQLGFMTAMLGVMAKGFGWL